MIYRHNLHLPTLTLPGSRRGNQSNFFHRLASLLPRLLVTCLLLKGVFELAPGRFCRVIFGPNDTILKFDFNLFQLIYIFLNALPYFYVGITSFY